MSLKKQEFAWEHSTVSLLVANIQGVSILGIPSRSGSEAGLMTVPLEPTLGPASKLPTASLISLIHRAFQKMDHKC